MEKLKKHIRSPMAFWYQNKDERTSVHSRQQDISTQTADFALDIALDIAGATTLQTDCPKPLSLIERSLNFAFLEQERCQLFLVTSSLQTMPEKGAFTSNTFQSHVITSEAKTSNTPLKDQLAYYFATLSTKAEDMQEALFFTLPQPKNDGQFYRHRLRLEGETQAWLVLFFPQKTPSLTNIQHHLSHSIHALSRGLKAFFDRQAQIEQAINTERASQAAELHDSMAQVLGYLRLKTSQLVSYCQTSHYQAKDDNELQALSKDIAYQTHSAYRATRELISTSRLATQDKSLPECIREAITEFEQQSNVVFELDNRVTQSNAKKNAKEQEAQLQFIVREALSNIVRHSHATHARVHLSSDTEKLTIKVEDNGQGIKIENKRPDSFGLNIMQERAAKIGAILTIEERLPQGTVVEITHSYACQHAPLQGAL